MICSRKQCKHNGIDQPLTNFGKSKQTSTGYHPWCKDCRKEYNKNNKDKIKTYNKQYKSSHIQEIFEYEQENKENKIAAVKKWKHNLAYFDTFKDTLSKYEEIRQDPSDLTLLQVKCTYCGEWYNPTNSTIHNRISTIDGKKNGEARLYCSDKCKRECPIYRQKDYYKFQENSYSREVQPELRKMVFERDNYTCQKCNTHKDNLEVGIQCHHIDPIINNPIESADIDNCITLCKDCHKLTHQKDGCNYGQLRCGKTG